MQFGRKFRISIHVPRVEDDEVWKKIQGEGFISIHVPRVEDDEELDEIAAKKEIFQSTSPVWRTTKKDEGRGYSATISIHVPRVEDDWEVVLVVG